MHYVEKLRIVIWHIFLSEETTKVKKERAKSFEISDEMNCYSRFIDVNRLQVLIYIVIFVQVSRVSIFSALR